ncbi:DUF5994 family protein [Streptosporangium sp. G11]|uniref:DUF5994 family protein n=1 Tax=Streptosporangium sp. G11 TaxID=3436926 RepID=UPI003EBDB5BB
MSISDWGVHQDAWRHIPRRIPAHGRQVRIGWFRHTVPRVINLSFTAGEPIVLPIIPPAAETTLKLTIQDTAGLTIDAILTLASPPPDRVSHGDRRGPRPRRSETTAMPVRCPHDDHGASGPSMAREDRTVLETTKARVGNPSLTWAPKCGAGDGNRTRAVSLGSVWITACRGAELGVRPVVSDRG